MNCSTRGTSSRVAGRMVMESVIYASCRPRACPVHTGPRPLLSSDALQSLRDAAGAREQRLEKIAIAAAAGAPALEQVHLHEIHRIDVGIAQPDGALQRRIAVQQVCAALQPQDALARPGVFGADLSRESPQRPGDEDVVGG